MQEGREELVAGRWLPSSGAAKMYNMLKGRQATYG